MKKTNDKKTITLHSRMNKKDLSLDVKKADDLKDNILKQLDIISKSFNEIHSILNRLNMKKYICDGSSGIVVQCAKRCLSQAQAARSLVMNFDAKYNEDQKNLIIEDLNDRIAFLEEKLAEMK